MRSIEKLVYDNERKLTNRVRFAERKSFVFSIRVLRVKRLFLAGEILMAKNEPRRNEHVHDSSRSYLKLFIRESN